MDATETQITSLSSSPCAVSNFFAALDSSDDENESPAPVAVSKSKKTGSKPKPVKEIVEPSKKPQRDNDKKHKDAKHNSKGKGGGRDFDRKSGTGRGKEVSKGGAGGKNWGSDRDEIRNEGRREKTEDNEVEEEDRRSRQRPVA
ncbi:hypothetical protein TL16_g00375 [Triparma laevis f. inornata]|uniref:Hyaluronan/mRNA-binding protein domain-containing protein n=1 Tax=Triparma laevis f. inornata TaxID=1714386 RepID=A0A9W6Z7H2_9STRA|nr:hypothetical protein TL16_g00375 [Triparma laevis f. inornata]